ncbi:MAG: hypothetical protein RLZZ127_483, partial [Planctomycetota bacterium]
MELAAAYAAVDRALAPMLAAVRPDGACWRAEFAIPDPGHTWGALILAATVQLAAAPGSPRRGDPALLDRARAMARWLRGQQRPTGRIDLLPCNYDSGPDSAFAWQLLIPARGWAAAVDPALAAELDAVLRP